MKTYTRDELITAIHDAADIGAPSASGRYNTARVLRLLNQAIEKYQVELQKFGTIKRTIRTVGTHSVDPSTYPDGELLSLPADFGALVAVHTLDTKERWEILNMNEDYQQSDWIAESFPYSSVKRCNVAWMGNAFGLRLLPAQSTGTQLIIEYRPTAVELEDPTDEWVCPYDGTVDVVICRVAMGLLERDDLGGAEGVYQGAARRFAEALSTLREAFAMADNRPRQMRRNMRQW